MTHPPRHRPPPAPGPADRQGRRAVIRASGVFGALAVVAFACGAAGAASSGAFAAGSACLDRPAAKPSADPAACKAHAAESGGWRSWAPGPESEPDSSGFDALHVDLTTEIDLSAERISGQALWRLELRQPAPANLVFDLSDSLRVSGAWVAGRAARFFQTDDRVHVALGGAPVAGDQLAVRLHYAGRPVRGFLLGFEFREHNGVPVAFTNCEPIAARTWWPCKDRPDDKFTADLRFIVPDTLIAVSNGTLEEVSAVAEGRRCYHWAERYPIASYLISVVATNLAEFVDEYTALDGRRMPVTHYAFPEHLAAAQRQWAVTPEAIAFFARIFGEYPFVEEKYGMAEFSWGGAMEHQTLTSMGSCFLDRPDPQDWVIVHELAHQWWGNWVTCGTWRDIWLNEGFAVYCEALWAEHRGGADSLHAQMAFNRRPGFAGSVYDPDFIFNSTVYRKGAWVLHMLRHVVGEKTFFSALRDYGQRHAYGTAVTEDLRRAFAAATGDSLHWFFDPWVYGQGRPLYGVWWEPVGPASSGRTEVRVRIVQESSGPQLFTMPLDARFLLADGEVFETVLWDSLPEQEFFVTTPAPPESLWIDPEQWVLCQIYENARPSAVAAEQPAASAGPPLRLGAPYPNPGRTEFWIPLHWPPANLADGETAPDAQRPIQLVIYDSQGRVVRRLAARYAGARQDGFHWDGRTAQGPPAPAGLYFARLAGGGAGSTGAEGRVRLLRLR